MTFIRDTFRILKDTAWPTGKQSWTDFLSVVEYTAFFVAVIYAFDFLLSKGIVHLIDLF